MFVALVTMSATMTKAPKGVHPPGRAVIWDAIQSKEEKKKGKAKFLCS